MYWNCYYYYFFFFFFFFLHISHSNRNIGLEVYLISKISIYINRVRSCCNLLYFYQYHLIYLTAHLPLDYYMTSKSEKRPYWISHFPQLISNDQYYDQTDGYRWWWRHNTCVLFSFMIHKFIIECMRSSESHPRLYIFKLYSLFYTNSCKR